MILYLLIYENGATSKTMFNKLSIALKTAVNDITTLTPSEFHGALAGIRIFSIGDGDIYDDYYAIELNNTNQNEWCMSKKLQELLDIEDIPDECDATESDIY